MLKKIYQSDSSKVILSFISGMLSIYIILFEFIVPANKILPKPSILIETVPSLYQDYNFLSAFLLTFSAIYSVMLISYFLMKIGNNILVTFTENFPGLKELFTIGKYFVPLFLIFLFQLWFDDSLWGEYLFIFAIVMGTLKSTIADEISSVKEAYINSAKSLGLTKREILDKVIWKSIQPKAYDSLVKIHIPIWSLVIIYEFICNTDGVGAIFKLALKYNDLSLVILLIAILIITILFMEFILKSIMKKYFFWN